MTQETIDRIGLRNLIRLYRVGFWVRRDRTDIDGRVVEVTFQLELRGTHGHCHGTRAGRPCPSCIRVLTALFEIADALLPIERDSANRIGHNYEKRMQYSRSRNPQQGVALGCEMRTRRPFEQANDGWALEFLEEVRRCLLEQGCRQVEPSFETETQTAPVDEVDRLSPRVLKKGDLVATHVA